MCATGTEYDLKIAMMERMQFSLGPRIKRFTLYLFFLITVPAAITGVWYVLVQAFPRIDAWLFLIGIQVLSGIFTLTFFLRGQPDIVAMELRERELAASQEQFEYLYERSPVPYLTLDNHGRVTMVNLAAIRLLETTAQKIAGQNFVDRLQFDEKTDPSIVLGKLKAGVSVTDIEVQVTTDDGDERWILLSIFVYGSRGERLVAMVDITHQKTVDQAKSEFVALAAHQLRTPLAAIRWNIELLRGQQSETTPTQNTYYEKVERNVMRMIRLINDFLSVSKLETGTFASEKESIPLHTFFDSVLDEHNQTITQKRLTIERSYQPPELSLTADTRLLHIVVNNLISNAVKYTDADGSVSVSYEGDRKTVTIVIADTGIGIPEVEQEKLFTKFYRATNARTHQAEGTGLGLYIVRESVKMMGGTITVSSEENKGTTFTAIIPMT